MRLLLFLAILLLPVCASAGAAPPPVLAARAYVLYDYASNQMLVASQSAHERLAPGALTKMMTAYLAFNAIRQHMFPLSRRIYPSLDAVGLGRGELRMYLDHNKPVTIDELLHGLIVQSADDAARTLAELVSGSEAAFAEQMNLHARALGMQDSYFVNATGQPDPRQFSSAYDLVLLAAAIVRDFTEYYPIYGMREYQYNSMKLFNGNRLLWNDPFIDGMTNGYAEAGYNLAVSSQRDDRRLIAVVIGTASETLRDSEGQKLLNYGFRNFQTVQLYKKNQPVASPRLWKGAEHTIDAGFPRGLSLTVPRGTLLQLRATMETHQPIIAPVKAGQPLGVLKLSLGGKPYAEFPLVALKDVPLANVFARGWDNIRLLFE